ncbi:hypothetical protein J6590_043025 [Homalodisca vitripennis]|nr:hypothetical protein J6590_043025 [Homalodisca vitripennis]
MLVLVSSAEPSPGSRIPAFRISRKARTLARYRAVSKESDTGVTAVYVTKDPRASVSTTAKLVLLAIIEPSPGSYIPARQLSMKLRIRELPYQQQISYSCQVSTRLQGASYLCDTKDPGASVSTAKLVLLAINEPSPGKSESFRINRKARTLAKYRPVSKEPVTCATLRIRELPYQQQISYSCQVSTRLQGASYLCDTKDPGASVSTAKLVLLAINEPSPGRSESFRINRKARTLAKYRAVSKEPVTVASDTVFPFSPS